MTGFEGEIVWDTSTPNGQPPLARRPRAAELFGFRAGHRRSARRSSAPSPGTARTRSRVTAARALAPFVALAWGGRGDRRGGGGGYEQALRWLLLLNQLLLAPVLVGAAVARADGGRVGGSPRRPLAVVLVLVLGAFTPT